MYGCVTYSVALSLLGIFIHIVYVQRRVLIVELFLE